MADKTYKNLLDDGYTTYHEDGTQSKTYKHLFDDGYTTHHEDGSRSDTYQHVFDDGYNTYHADGSTSDSYRHVFDDGYVTYNSDGSRSDTYSNILDDGFTTYHSRGASSGSSYGGYGSTGYSYGGGGIPPSIYRYGYADGALFWISLLVFAANICFCFLPYMFYEGSFIGIAAFNNDWILFQFSYMPRIITSLFSVGFLSYTVGRRWGFHVVGAFGNFAVAVWSLIICLTATTARYMQAGFSAANGRDAWKFFTITLVIFFATQAICRHLRKRKT